MRNKKALFESRIEIAEDFPMEIRNRRTAVAPIIKSLKEKGYKAILKVDQIHVNGECWSLEQANDAINEDNHEYIVNKDIKRTRTSPLLDQYQGDSSRTNDKRPPPLKLQKHQPTNLGSTPTSSIKSSIVSVKTPLKNDQYVHIISND
ncbi:hypothetical protein ACFFRR_005299 [Megaselia abdita]